MVPHHLSAVSITYQVVDIAQTYREHELVVHAHFVTLCHDEGGRSSQLERCVNTRQGMRKLQEESVEGVRAL